ncbi:hypothetical protein EV215_0227 [Hypnocyclicus thermotrophus]|uniref:Uncharacterized protein n=1 Tax=Hypnocyclicus thermotrophus TaxID=1627895 RepID=A0AA46E0D4_9FUSO|nr:hypothetical protein [Hypnocyclicus thermotrophus]TDT72421.1 hypothetical protein EV215_0227 [Hypnocyclicus thermotrophus]
MKKKIIILLLILSSITFANIDGLGGASLNEHQTIKVYNNLVKTAKLAIKKNDFFVKEEIYDNIENFINIVNSYKNKSGHATEKTKKMINNLNKIILKLETIDGLGGASINQKSMVERYKKTITLADKAIKTGKNKNIAKREVNDLLDFITKWKSSQSSGAKKYLNDFEKTLKMKYNKL